jgi:HAE1 family hydrophobic/amphiphilic exporter-1
MREELVRGDQRALRADDLLSYPLATHGNRTVYLRNVSQVIDGPAERRSTYRFNGHEAVEASVIENPEASSPRVIAAVLARLGELERAHPGVTFTRAYDNARFVDILTHNMTEELLVSVILVGLVLLIFLEDLSATLIVMTAIPTCLGLAVLLFVPMGFSINSSTLIGLLLAIGRLVDDSIVVIHAVHRRLVAGSTSACAAVDGTLEVILPIAAATGVMALALVSLLTSGGITQIMFVGLVWPIIFALLASLVVSVTLTPLLAAFLFHGEATPTQPWRTRIDAAMVNALAPTRHALARIETAYHTALVWSIDHVGATLALAALLTYIGVQLFPFIGRDDAARRYQPGFGLS